MYRIFAICLITSVIATGCSSTSFSEDPDILFGYASLLATGTVEQPVGLDADGDDAPDIDNVSPLGGTTLRMLDSFGITPYRYSNLEFAGKIITSGTWDHIAGRPSELQVQVGENTQTLEFSNTGGYDYFQNTNQSLAAINLTKYSFVTPYRANNASEYYIGVVGVPATAADMPDFGAAVYTGFADGRLVFFFTEQGPLNTIPLTTLPEVEVTANFELGSVNVIVTNFFGHDVSAINMTIDGNKYSGGTVTVPDEIIDQTIIHSTNASGQFFGPATSYSAAVPILAPAETGGIITGRAVPYVTEDGQTVYGTFWLTFIARDPTSPTTIESPSQ